MRLKPSLTVCIAALIHPFRTNPLRSKGTHVPAAGAFRTPKLSAALIRNGMMAAIIAFTSFHLAAAQEAAPNTDATSDTQSVHPNSVYYPSPDAIMGFESPYLWGASAASVNPNFNAQATTVRTQGTEALEVINPPAVVTLSNYPVSSSATALTGIGNRGALLQLDVQVQITTIAVDPKVQEQANEIANEASISSEIATTTTNVSSIQAFVSSKSRGLNMVSLGTVSFAKLRTGLYNTIAFNIPDSVSSALGGATYNDLIFTFVVTAPENILGAYLFDNLRVHSVAMVQSPAGIAPPSGYGGSLNLVVTSNKVVNRSFTLSPAQIPSSFHLYKGTAPKTSVQLQYGLDSKPALTCTYLPASTSVSEQGYSFKSCTGGYLAGDLVKSNWMGLLIVNGTVAHELHAQLAVSPLGDLSGSGLIPPMPTYWGDSDTCMPAAVKGKVVTTSTSCASQIKKANQIVNAYFTAVDATHPTADWIVAPVANSALRAGTAIPANFLGNNGPPANDIPFDTGGDLNPGGSFDAYWRLSGNLIPTAVAGTDENLTHFDATFTTHGVLFGDDIDVVDAKLTADTDSGQTTPAYKPATSTGNLGFYVFGEEVPSGGLSFSPSTGFSVDPSWTQEYDLPSIQIWIFDITLGALVDADLKASGSAALSGADLSVVPTASLGGHISGGINLVVADGNVDAKVNLISLSAPIEAQVKWVINPSPELCAATMNGSLKGDVTVASGGGQVDLDATFGYCPFCYTKSWTLFKWNALVSHSWNLFNDTIDLQLFPLPTSMCKYPITVKIDSPNNGATVLSGLPVVFTGVAHPNDPNVAYTSTYKWTYTPGANATTMTIDPATANTSNPSVTFATPPVGKTATWTVGLTSTVTDDSATTKIAETASATPITVLVSAIKPGVYISQITSSNNGIAIVDPTTGVYNVGNIPGTVTFSGVVQGGTGTLNTVFSLVYCNDYTPQCTSPGAPTILTTTGAATRTPSATAMPGEGFYKITMTSTGGATTIGTTSAVIEGYELF